MMRALRTRSIFCCWFWGAWCFVCTIRGQMIDREIDSNEVYTYFFSVYARFRLSTATCGNVESGTDLSRFNAQYLGADVRDIRAVLAGCWFRESPTLNDRVCVYCSFLHTHKKTKRNRCCRHGACKPTLFGQIILRINTAAMRPPSCGRDCALGFERQLPNK